MIRLLHKSFLAGFFCCCFVSISSSSEPYLDFTPGSRAVGLGYSGVVQVYDPTALYWNPASLALVKHSAVTLANHDPYMLNYLGYSQYIPKVATFGIGFGRTAYDSDAATFGAIGAARKIFTSTYVGGAIHSIESFDQNYASASFGFLFQPRTTLWDPPRNLFYSPYVVDRLAFGLTVQNLGFVQNNTHQIRIGASYKFGLIGPTLVVAHHFSPNEDSDHFGLLFEPIKNLNVFTGFKNYEPDNMSIGLGYEMDNFLAQVSYDAFKKRLTLSANVRLGATAEQIADRYYQTAKNMLRSRSKREALMNANLALQYDSNHQNSYMMMQRLLPIVAQEDAKIDSLLREGERFESKGYYMGAAAQYLQILKIDPGNTLTKERIAMIRPRVEYQTEKWYLQGYELYNKRDMNRAKVIFESILLVQPDHIGSNNYLKKIHDIEFKQAEQHFYAGLGYYSQHNLDSAEREFNAALSLVADFPDATKYIEEIRKERRENDAHVKTLLSQAQDYESKGLWKSAQATYRQVLATDRNREHVREKIQELDVKINNYVTRFFNRGVQAFQNGDYARAKSDFNRVLAMEEDNTEAASYLEQIVNETDDKTIVFYNSAQELVNEGNWEMALAVLDSALNLNPEFQQASDLRYKTVQMIANEALLNKAKNEIRNGDFLQAMEELDKIVQQDPHNLEALELREFCQKELNKKVDEYFNRGIQLYIEEKYAQAIETWDIVLRINPYHKGADEYKKRAQERLKTLNRIE